MNGHCFTKSINALLRVFNAWTIKCKSCHHSILVNPTNETNHFKLVTRQNKCYILASLLSINALEDDEHGTSN